MKLWGVVTFLMLLAVAGAAAQEVPDWKALQARVNALSDQQIIGCIEGFKTCPLSDADKQHVSRYEFTDALQEHGDIDFLISAYRHHPEARDTIAASLWQMRADDPQFEDPRVERFMRTIAFVSTTGFERDDTGAYYAARYLAERCDESALARLNEPKNFAVIGWCPERSEQMKQFGICKYYPAARHLAHRLSNVCLNETQGATEALEMLFPGACKTDNLQQLDDGTVTRCYLRAIAARNKTLKKNQR